MAVDYFLAVDGIPGESTAAKFKGQIDVLGFSWGVSQSGSFAVGGGAGAGKAEFDELVVAARTSKASPKLMLACASGQHIKTVVLTVRRGARSKQEFLRVELEDVLVSSYEIGSDDEPPLDQVAFAFAKAKVEYVPFDKAGKAGPPVTFGWDVKKNTSS